jgi:hypothetical protein
MKKTYYKETVEEIWDLMEATRRGDIKPKVVVVDDIKDFLVYFIDTGKHKYRIIIEPDTFSMKRDKLSRTYLYNEKVYGKSIIRNLLKSIERFSK